MRLYATVILVKISSSTEWLISGTLYRTVSSIHLILIVSKTVLTNILVLTLLTIDMAATGDLDILAVILK